MWDRLFGWFELERSEISITCCPARRIGSFDPIKIVFDEREAMVHDVKRARRA
jgi:hypothetical protein